MFWKMCQAVRYVTLMETIYSDENTEIGKSYSYLIKPVGMDNKELDDAENLILGPFLV